MIRPATEDDIDFLAELEILLFPENRLNERVLRNEIEHGLCYVIEGRGYLLTRWDEELVDVLRLGIHPEHQHQGLGRELMEYLLERVWTPVVLTVRMDNLPARKLYESLGFTYTGWMPPVDALVMTKRRGDRE